MPFHFHLPCVALRSLAFSSSFILLSPSSTKTETGSDRLDDCGSLSRLPPLGTFPRKYLAPITSRSATIGQRGVSPTAGRIT